MSLTFGTSIARVDLSWADFKAQAISKNLSSTIQYVEQEGKYIIFFVDQLILYTCIIWTGIVPDGVSGGGYSQAQNNADKTDFETNYQNVSNNTISTSLKDGESVTSTTPATIIMGVDSGVARILKTDATGKLLLSSPEVHNEIPTGAINGINSVFLTFYVFKTSTTKLYLNGIRQREGIGNDYLENVNRDGITFSTPPLSGDTIIVHYVKE